MTLVRHKLSAADLLTVLKTDNAGMSHQDATIAYYHDSVLP